MIEDYICNYCSIYAVTKQLIKDDDPDSHVNKLRKFIEGIIQQTVDDFLENISKVFVQSVLKIVEYCRENNYNHLIKNIKFKPLKTVLYKSSIIKSLPSPSFLI